MIKCEHKTGQIILDEVGYSIALCDWGCNSYLLITETSTTAIGDVLEELDALRRVADEARHGLKKRHGENWPNWAKAPDFPDVLDESRRGHDIRLMQALIDLDKLKGGE